MLSLKVLMDLEISGQPLQVVATAIRSAVCDMKYQEMQDCWSLRSVAIQRIMGIMQQLPSLGSGGSPAAARCFVQWRTTRQKGFVSHSPGSSLS